MTEDLPIDPDRASIIVEYGDPDGRAKAIHPDSGISARGRSVSNAVAVLWNKLYAAGEVTR